ncbi:MAG: adenosine kinase [Lentisphaeria bacterium]|nr:adenosine kinase [Lentisphaeria bacterium]
MAEIIGVGSSLVDILASVPEEFLDTVTGGKGGMELVDRDGMRALLARLPENRARVPGGSAANTIVGLAALGNKARLLAKVGADEAGGFYVDNAADLGVSRTAFKVSEGEATGTCISLVTPDSERTMRTFLGAAATLSPEEVTVADFAGCAHAHLEGYLLFNRDLALHVLRIAREADCSVSLDLASPEVVGAAADILPQLLSDYVDMVFANEEEAAVFAGTRDERACLDALSAVCSVAVVKLGARGALIRGGDDDLHVPAKRVEAIDATGAGDSWAAGFLYGLFHDRSLYEAGLLGADVAARVVVRMGAALPTEEWAAVRVANNLK